MNDLKISTEFRFGYFGKHQEKIREGFLKPGEPRDRYVNICLSEKNLKSIRD